jgi:predicted DNA-binding transcriptional regulator YafY
MGANQYRKMQIPDFEGTAQTAERLASELKVSRATIERDAKFALAVDALIEMLYQFSVKMRLINRYGLACQERSQH